MKLTFPGIILLGCVTLTICTIVVGYCAWDPGPATSECFDKGRNGLWVGHQWYTGFKVGSGVPVSTYERDGFIRDLHRYRVKYVFIHAGPVKPDGSISDMPGLFFDTLKRSTPDVRYIPWIGGDVRVLPIDSPAWRNSFLQTLHLLRSAGFDGVHLDFEPLGDFFPGYLELLSAIRHAFEKGFFISHATRRLNSVDAFQPVAKYNFWSRAFYKACMERCDQTVLMGYDTCIKLPKLYMAFIRDQTAGLLAIAAEIPGHRVMIGIPSYDDVPALSDPRVENIRNAAGGVRAALEEGCSSLNSFEGVAVYAHWTTSPEEWKHYEVYWLMRQK